MDQSAKRITDLPSDIQLQILHECDVLDVLNLSSTCRQLQQVADEHQVWLGQAEHLCIPMPPGTTPSKTELKDWVISRTKAEVCWVKSSPGRLVVHSFEMDGNFVDAHLVPGGEFVVIYYATGDIALNKLVKSLDTGKILDMKEVARYKGIDGLDDHPGYWSRLLTEMSYGCPVLVVVGNDADFEPVPSIFLIDPISQVIKKECIQCNFNLELVLLRKVLGVGSAVFFVCYGLVGRVRVTAVFEPIGPNAVARTFLLRFPLDYGPDDTRVFAVSEHGLIVAHYSGIFLYHIPDLRLSTDGFGLSPVWEWRGDASCLRGSLRKTKSPFPTLWLQGGLTTHTLEFDANESGFPVVAKHDFAGAGPAFHSAEHIKLQGRKGMSIEGRLQGQIALKTRVLEKPDIMRQLSVSIPGLNDCPLWDEFKYADLDELTGRIMIVVGPPSGRRQNYVPYARQLYIADLAT